MREQDAAPTVHEAASGQIVQLPLPGLARARVCLPKRRKRRAVIDPPHSGYDDLLDTYLRRLRARGVATMGFAAYRSQLHCLLRTAARIASNAVTCGDLFRDPSLLGRALVDDLGQDGRQLSRWTLAQRRSAVRSFASLMAPELTTLLDEDPHAVLDRALRSVARRVGTGYRLTGGVPRRRGGYAPTASEVAAVTTTAGAETGFAGARNAAFFSILGETGARVNALRELDGTDYVTMPSGRIRLFLHAKGRGRHGRWS
jgi:hypothetical protein